MHRETQQLGYMIFMVVVLIISALPALAEGQDRAVLKVLDGDDVIVIDEVSRRDGRLEVDTDSVGRARFKIEAKLTDDEGIAEARIRIWPEGKSDPEMDATAKISGGNLFWGRTGEDPRIIRVPKNTVIYIPPSATAMEQTVRYAMAVRGQRDKVDLKVWSPYKIEEVNDAEVRFTEPGTAELTLFGATYTLTIDAEGNILSGRVEPQGNTIIRE